MLLITVSTQNSLALPCRHEKVQENCIDLVGRIADRGAEFVPAREWMRICFELLDMLKVGPFVGSGHCLLAAPVGWFAAIWCQ